MALTLASDKITFTDSTSLSSGIIGTAQLSAGAVTADKIASGAVTSDKLPVGSVVRTEYAEILGQTSYSGNNIDTTVTSPTTADGHQLFSIPLATSSSSNYIIFRPNLSVTSSGGGQVLVMLFAGNTLIAARSLEAGNGYVGSGFIVKYTPPNTNSITYSLRAGVRTTYGDLQLNRIYTVPQFWNTGKEISSLLIQEIKG